MYSAVGSIVFLRNYGGEMTSVSLHLWKLNCIGHNCLFVHTSFHSLLMTLCGSPVHCLIVLLGLYMCLINCARCLGVPQSSLHRQPDPLSYTSLMLISLCPSLIFFTSLPFFHANFEPKWLLYIVHRHSSSRVGGFLLSNVTRTPSPFLALFNSSHGIT